MINLNSPEALKPINEAAVGDLLAVPGKVSVSVPIPYMVQTVVRLTTTQIITGANRRFRRSDGKEIAPSAATRGYDYAVVVGLDYVEALTHAKARLEQQRVLRNWFGSAGLYRLEYPIEAIEAMKNACDKWFEDHPEVKKPSH